MMSIRGGDRNPGLDQYGSIWVVPAISEGYLAVLAADEFTSMAMRTPIQT